MSDPDINEGLATVPCDVCMKEVPTSEAKVEEADDYVRHFCGLECYTKWRQNAEQEKDG